MKGPSHTRERALAGQGYLAVCGIDEVGRGCWAGPLVGAGVIFDPAVKITGVNDSKKLSPKQRETLSASIREKAHACVVVEISVAEIDEIGIGKANAELVHRIIAALSADYALIDHVAIRHIGIPHEIIVKGDSKVFSIAAASIVAKVHRDALMAAYALEYPGYGFESHKGYGTKEHQQALKKFGHTPLHRRSFHPVSQPLLFDSDA